ncbi:MAG: imidazole glycerol phosphate synthase subunit HisH [Desulfovibrio sp.]|nr:imidazole glycerol phosphate synthase subunit HisH [Desulfovibrio sp.]
MLGIVDYGAGNQTSVRRALDALGITSTISHDAEKLWSCQGIIVPGVGAAGQAMQQLRGTGLDGLLKDAAKQGRPVLGICLGCQILLDYSEENDTDLLGLIHGQCRRFASDLTEEDGRPAPVPHMGWNTLHIQQKDCSLLKGLPSEAFFYFVHSYYIDPESPQIIAQSYYGHPFTAIVGHEGLWGVQFHPEKSGRPGLQLLKNFYTFCQEDKNHAQ